MNGQKRTEEIVVTNTRTIYSEAETVAASEKNLFAWGQTQQDNLLQTQNLSLNKLI